MAGKNESSYYLVHFLLEEGVFDIVCRNWLKYDATKDRFFSKFHSGKTSVETKEAEKLLKKQKPAPPDWKYYPVAIRGAAGNVEFSLT